MEARAAAATPAAGQADQAAGRQAAQAAPPEAARSLPSPARSRSTSPAKRAIFRQWDGGAPPSYLLGVMTSQPAREYCTYQLAPGTTEVVTLDLTKADGGVLHAGTWSATNPLREDHVFIHRQTFIGDGGTGTRVGAAFVSTSGTVTLFEAGPTTVSGTFDVVMAGEDGGTSPLTGHFLMPIVSCGP